MFYFVPNGYTAKHHLRVYKNVRQKEQFLLDEQLDYDFKCFANHRKKTAENVQKIIKRKAENKDHVSVALCHYDYSLSTNAWTNKQKLKQQDYSP